MLSTERASANRSAAESAVPRVAASLLAGRRHKWATMKRSAKASGLWTAVASEQLSEPTSALQTAMQTVSRLVAMSEPTTVHQTVPEMDLRLEPRSEQRKVFPLGWVLDQGSWVVATGLARARSSARDSRACRP